MKFNAAFIEAGASEDADPCHLCGCSIDFENEPFWEVEVEAPGTVFHGEFRHYHADCWSPDEEGV